MAFESAEKCAQKLAAASMSAQDRLKAEVWEIHKRLLLTYSSVYKQYDDMIRMGRIAQAIKDLGKAQTQVTDILYKVADKGTIKGDKE